MTRFIADSSAASISWTRSSYSGGNSNCVEVGTAMDGVAVRDSKDPHGPAFVITSGGWSGFVSAFRHVPLSSASWFKSSHSGTEANCVEVAHLSGVTAVRDSKVPQQSVLAISESAWSCFVSAVGLGELSA